MGIGINLGNTFDAFGDWIAQWGDGTPKSYYTAWGSPEITQEMIKGYYDEGFRVLRVPVHWFNLMDEEYNISEDFMDAVKQTVDWAMEAGLYVILNIHHDERDLFHNMTVTKDENMKNYLHIWEQIAEVFKDYDDHLMFESMNEEGCWNDLYNPWGDGTGKEEALGLLNEINQNFVDLIRKSGGNNGERHLLIAGYCTDIDHTTDPLYKVPNDPMNRCAVSVHYYAPASFAILSEDADWGKATTTWGSKDDLQEMNKLLDTISEAFIDRDIPVIIGEYGCAAQNKEYESLLNYEYSVTKGIYDRHMVPVIWDTPGGRYNRTTCVMEDAKLKELLMSVPESSE